MSGRATTAGIALVLVVGCTPQPAPTTTGPPETTVTTVTGAVGPVAPPVRHPATSGSIYFVMTDRFENGDPSNDTGGIEGDALRHGFLAANKAYYHGGDLDGLRSRLGYVDGLGMTAIWITPPFVNRPVQGVGTVEGSSAGYHGYWQVDWTRVDPHLGDDQDLEDLVAATHDMGIDVYLDAVVNHTADVITYPGGSAPYRPLTQEPYEPVFASPEDASVKRPDWLDDVTSYHNRGDSTFNGESAVYGDIFGLDDLATEDPGVVDGMIDVYSGVIEQYGIDGFRIDTVKHVDDEFWTQWGPAMTNAAGNDFFMFGEVFSSDSIVNSRYMTELGLPGLLDFRLHDALTLYVAQGADASVMVNTFDDDDWYTDADSNASMLVKFFGNHDIGRMGWLVRSGNPGGRSEVTLGRMQLGFDLLFLTRGMPVVYYGDEQGFAGTGGDQDARQDMFPSLTPEYTDQETIGSVATPGDDNFDLSHPLYERVALLNSLRAQHPVLASGAQIVHPPQGSVFAFSRLDRDDRTEYLVVTNNATVTVPVTVPALTTGAEFEVLLAPTELEGPGPEVGGLGLVMPPLSTVVLRAAEPLRVPATPPTVELVRPEDGGEIPSPRYRLEARVGDRRYAEVTFSIRVDGDDPVILGTDDAPPFRLYWSNGDLPAGTVVEITATVDDRSRLATDSVTVTLGDRG